LSIGLRGGLLFEHAFGNCSAFDRFNFAHALFSASLKRIRVYAQPGRARSGTLQTDLFLKMVLIKIYGFYEFFVKTIKSKGCRLASAIIDPLPRGRE
jgi:hypothetical protein